MNPSKKFTLLAGFLGKNVRGLKSLASETDLEKWNIGEMEY
jgi:hypothetical protein